VKRFRLEGSSEALVLEYFTNGYVFWFYLLVNGIRARRLGRFKDYRDHVSASLSITIIADATCAYF